MDSPAWQTKGEDEPNPGFTSAVYWVRFQLVSTAARRVLLGVTWANLDLVTLYVVQPGGEINRMQSGTYVPFGRRAVPYRYPLFAFDLTPHQFVWCYVQVVNAHAIFPLFLWNESAFHDVDRNQQFIFGLVMGLLLIVVFFNTLFFLATKDKAFLYYVIFALFYLLFDLAFRGIAGQYLWPRQTWLDNNVEVSSASLALTMGILFTRAFLQTKTSAPAMHRLLGAILVMGIVNTLSTFIFPFTVMVQVTNGLLIVIEVVLLFSAIGALRSGFRAARFYLAAWIVLLPGGIIFGLLNFGLVPSNLATRNAMSFGAFLEIILLFLAIFDRYLMLRRDSEKLQRERLEAVEKRLYWDTLTDLPNRNRLVANLKAEKLVTIILVNIDDFKEINDSFGQKAGDQVIVELGNRIREVACPRGGAVYRLHADEFAVVLDSGFDEEVLDSLGRSLVARCQAQPYYYENERLRLNVGVGIAVTDNRHLEKADVALTEARSKKTVAFYRPELETIRRYVDNLRWLHVIRESIEQDRIVPFFQPIMSNRSGSIEKFEALMRIRTADGEFISPGAFFDIAKKSKLYPDLSGRIIEKSANIIRMNDKEVSINISLEDIVHPDVRKKIELLVSEDQIGKRVVFELLESEGIENYNEVSRFIELVKKHGCKIAIDDFGAGYSNFEHILRLRVDYLKIDASLIKPIATDANAHAIVETIVSFASRLGIQTVAEFVHSEAVQRVVRTLGVDYSQGYFVGKPLPEMIHMAPAAALWPPVGGVPPRDSAAGASTGT
jgi:diguanylate cyclase (GGDEF)-like protein